MILSSLVDQVRAYALMRENLERKHFGRWVIISAGQPRGDYKTHREASEAATDMDLNKAECLFRQVEMDGPVIVPMDASAGRESRFPASGSSLGTPLDLEG